MVLPFTAMQRVEVTCAHCGHANVRLAAAVKKGSLIGCESCRRRFRVNEVRVLIGSASRR